MISNTVRSFPIFIILGNKLWMGINCTHVLGFPCSEAHLALMFLCNRKNIIKDDLPYFIQGSFQTKNNCLAKKRKISHKIYFPFKRRKFKQVLNFLSVMYLLPAFPFNTCIEGRSCMETMRRSLRFLTMLGLQFILFNCSVSGRESESFGKGDFTNNP